MDGWMVERKFGTGCCFPLYIPIHVISRYRVALYRVHGRRYKSSKALSEEDSLITRDP